MSYYRIPCITMDPANLCGMLALLKQILEDPASGQSTSPTVYPHLRDTAAPGRVSEWVTALYYQHCWTLQSFSSFMRHTMEVFDHLVQDQLLDLPRSSPSAAEYRVTYPCPSNCMEQTDALCAISERGVPRPSDWRSTFSSICLDNLIGIVTTTASMHVWALHGQL